jgi:RNA polymerase sigma-70 factor (ECF subfamily)
MIKAHQFENPLCTTSHGAVQMSFTSLVNRIKVGDSSAEEELYWTFEKGIRRLLVRYCNNRDIDDQLQHVVMSVIEAIRCDRLREPECLPSFIRTIVQRTRIGIARKAIRFLRFHLRIDSIRTRCTRTPEEQLRDKERVALTQETLVSMSAREKELLTRFYIRDQHPQQICVEMGMTHAQFRLLKSRAQHRFTEAATLSQANR